MGEIPVYDNTELESYKRIDIMCTLLNMCLPFELRFLGTCLEELGRRDSQELRGIELRVNNPLDLAADMTDCQKGEPTDKKIRRKMALYLALIRACNRSYVSEIFRTLEGWGECAFNNMKDLDTLQELLLVYTMAANHPVFSFEQHMKCTEIFEKIKANKLVRVDKDTIHESVHIQPPSECSLKDFYHHKTDLRHHIPPTQQDIMCQEHTLHAVHISEQHQIHNNSIPVTSQGSLAVTIPLSHVGKQPSQSTSPVLSQKSSPANSRASSPHGKCNFLNSQGRNIPKRVSTSLRKALPSSTETELPSTGHTQYQKSNEINLPSNIKQIDKVIIGAGSSMTQLQTLIRNGFGRNTSFKQRTGNLLSHYHHQLPVNQNFSEVPPGNITISAGFAYSMQNMTLIDAVKGSHSLDNCLIEQHGSRNILSDSGSSIGSVGEISPPQTPAVVTNLLYSQGTIRGNDLMIHKSPSNSQAIHYNNKQINHTRGNESLESNTSVSSGCRSASNSFMFTPTSNESFCNNTSLQQYMGADIILSPSADSSSARLMQSSIATNVISNSVSNTYTCPISDTAVNAVSANNSVVKAVFITSPSTTVNCGILSNVITSNSLIQQQQYNGSFSYHGSTQHVTTSTRSSIIPQNQGIGPQVPGSFRLPALQIPPNGEVRYTSYDPAGVAFLSSGLSGASAVDLRAINSANVNQQTNPQSKCLQQTHQLVTSDAVQHAASPYIPLSIPVSKPISCYNCGSQKHNGRDCYESTMDDVSRNAIYKLDYSVSVPNVSSVTAVLRQSNPIRISSSSVISKNISDNDISKKQKAHVIDVSKIIASSTITP